jgi:hypothetical protein
LQPSVVHTLPSLQTVGPPGLHAPPPHVSPVVQALPSSQAWVLATKAQAPVAGLQLSDVQGLLSLQTTAEPGLHAPPPHRSPTVQAVPSEQELVLAVKTQLPETGLQLSVVQTFPSLQTVAVPARQVPPLQKSPFVQALPSLQALALFAKTHPVPGLQLSVVQTLPSLQTVAPPGLHAPPPHVSPVVQALPSLQALVLLANTQAPVAGLQLSVVQMLLSLHATTAPGWHVPPPHASPEVQALPSLHGPVLSVKRQVPFSGSQPSVVQALPSSQTVGRPG